MWQTVRFCSSQVYMSRVHGLVNDSFSTSSTPSRSFAGERLDPVGVIGPVCARASSASVRRTYSGRMACGGGGCPPSQPRRQPRDDAGQQRRDRIGDKRPVAQRLADQIAIGCRAVADERDRIGIRGLDFADACESASASRARHDGRLDLAAVLVQRRVDLAPPGIDPRRDLGSGFVFDCHPLRSTRGGARSG